MGFVPAKVTIADQGDAYAKPTENSSTGALESTGSGSARIVWKAGDYGEQWCLLQLGAGGGSESVDRGCWAIAASTRTVDGETEAVRVFTRQYYLDGEVAFELELNDAVEDFVCQGDLEEGSEYTEGDRPYVCLRVPATTDATDTPSLVAYASLSEMQSAQRDASCIVKPLYKLTHEGAVAVDFRNCPAFQMAEMI